MYVLKKNESFLHFTVTVKFLDHHNSCSTVNSSANLQNIQLLCCIKE